MFDPRRPKGKPTTEEQEEWLVQYDPLIPDDSKRVISHNYKVRPALDSFMRCLTFDPACKDRPHHRQSSSARVHFTRLRLRPRPLLISNSSFQDIRRPQRKLQQGTTRTDDRWSCCSYHDREAKSEEEEAKGAMVSFAVISASRSYRHN